MTLKKWTIFILGTLLFTVGCATKQNYSDTNNTGNSASQSPYFEKLVMVDSLGITGADGVISFPLSKKESVFMMGDSFLSKVEHGKRDSSSIMINNSFIIIDNKKGIHKALYNGTPDKPESFLKPANEKEYYWPGDGFKRKGLLHLFMTRFEHIDEDWGFRFTGTDYIRMAENDFKVVSVENFPYSNVNDVHYGHSLLNQSGYVYIYGSKFDGKVSELHVARALLDPKEGKLKNYQFFDGSEWVANPSETKKLKGINKLVPEQFSVFKYGKVYVLLMMDRDFTTGNIYSYTSNSPVGPWGNEKKLYHTTEQEQYSEDRLFTYNAMAHPQYIQDDRLLISYCVNSFMVPKIHEHVEYYRPRFLWVPLQMILGP
ncbi:DUF4185 domain-containing protein [Maribacter sp. 2307ULW6-5]|uniref:DUF4185 domain-containing protein n=1 Tax=Maribacter sp. 2307ULW6-5 TaxID=3386275 RepID=UPI0039BD587E